VLGQQAGALKAFAAPLILAFSLVGCDTGDSNSANTLSTHSDTTAATTTGATTTSTPSPPPLTHQQFVGRLDRICRKANGLVERRFGAATEAAIEANDYEKVADLLERADRVDRSFDADVERLSDRVPDEDARALRKYLALSDELDNYRDRFIRALRHREDEEIDRLDKLDDRARNQRTRVTAQMGLKYCGA
jgi:hypothetical protein